ncbi:hypothetical protein BH09PAT2_BH09PAT2_11150 [soil metagenome]
MKIDSTLKQEFKQFVHEAQKQHSTKPEVTIVAPYQLGEEELSLLKGKISLLKEAHIKTEVDASLLAGVIIKYGSRMIDITIRTELQKLQHTLYETA